MSETVAQPPVGEDFCAVLVSVDDFMELGFDVFVDDEIAPSIRFFDEGGVFAQPVSHLRLDGGDDGVGVDLFVGLGSVFGFTHGLLNLSWSEGGVFVFGLGILWVRGKVTFLVRLRFPIFRHKPTLFSIGKFSLMMLLGGIWATSTAKSLHLRMWFLLRRNIMSMMRNLL